mmetsp:Transcript_12816/g.36002  ORF Transcript_12816/g.36002 Transcript_12816/m.36002 type:complete len:261 (-) Transcript_12816:752-1534(-)|eukprot:CAMPEP_0117685338 /NCGR_PEP_ID=MMETSP0804-20121206/21676_1 /TAXON_ID=1074897 /ORGANISM="Tetraselmis astigmatica, Strain CCMP880" /LENGTH=260 /DNA_ID=CAMNT_0005496583 /DNA_START=222 /DNA_END=1004 /DNA_ORIENTATION=+
MSQLPGRSAQSCRARAGTNCHSVPSLSGWDLKRPLSAALGWSHIGDGSWRPSPPSWRWAFRASSTEAPSPGRGDQRQGREKRVFATSSEETSVSSGTPGYQTVLQGDGYSIRLYDTHFVVKTAYSRRDEGFETLGRYLEGANEASARLPAPQPVFMTYWPGSAKTMQLFVPTPKSVPLPPLPTAPGVALEVAGGVTMAAIQFTGYATEEAATMAKDALMAAVKRDGLRLANEDGEFTIAQYGPIFSLSTRVNELLMPLKL